MSSHAKDSFHHLLAQLFCLCRAHDTCDSRSAQLGECDLIKHTVVPPAQWKSLSPEVDLSSVANPGASSEHLVGFVQRLKPLLPPSCKLFGSNDWKTDGLHPIGGGGYAEIWVCKRNNGHTAVIKSYRRHSSSNHLRTFLRFYKEALVCSHLNGTNDEFIPFLGIYSSPDHPFALVFETMDHPHLGEYLRSNQKVGRVKLLLQIARGLEKMHNRGIIHANIKITNILVDSDKRARIGGLGAACVQSSTPAAEVDRFFHGAAPEVADPQRWGVTGTGLSTASDVYAFGVLSWQVFAGQVPFFDEGIVAGVHAMTIGRRPARPTHPQLSDRIWKLIEGSWRVDAAQRMTMAEAIAILEARE